MKELKMVVWSAVYEIAYVDGVFDFYPDSTKVNIAEVGLFGQIIWNQPQYKDDPKVLEAIEAAKQHLSTYLSENVIPDDDTISHEQFMEDVFKLVDFWEDTEKEDFKQNVAAEVGRFVDDENELIEISKQYLHLANHNYMSVLRVQQFLQKNK